MHRVMGGRRGIATIGMTLLALSGCSKRDAGWVRVSLNVVDRGASRAEVMDLSRVLRPSFATLPLTVDGFDCLALNVTGFGVSPHFADDPAFTDAVLSEALAGDACTYFGATSNLALLGETGSVTLETTVPSGFSRLVQVMGIQSTSGCELPLTLAGLAETEPETISSLVEVGRTVVDLIQDTDVSIENAYNPADPGGFDACQAARLSGRLNLSATPFAALGEFVPAGHPSKTLTSTTINGNTFGQTTPFVASKLTIDGTVTWNPAGPAQIFVLAGDVEFVDDSHLSADGLGGGDAPLTTQGGAGGKGGSGGGGGATGSSSSVVGGTGGTDGVAGATGNSIGGTPGQGGGGNPDAEAFSFDFDDGGNGGAGGQGGSGGAVGGAAGQGGGAVGGGGGGGSTNVAGNVAAGGGGGGGGLLVLVARSIRGIATVSAEGGDGGDGNGTTNGGGGGGGGGGVIWIATRSYDGQLSPNFAGGAGGNTATAATAPQPGSEGSARIFRLRGDGTLEEKDFTDTW